MKHEEMLEKMMLGYRWGSQYMFSEPPISPLGSMGNQLSRTSGSSLEFMEHREYKPGDDLRRIDWGVYARSDRLSVKLFQDEVNPHVDLLLDTSKSMDLKDTRKGEALCALIGMFSSMAYESHFSFSVFTTEDGCRKLGRSNLLPDEWDPFELNSVVPPSDSLERMPPSWRARGIRIFVSDLLFMADPESLLAHISQGSAMTIIIQLLAKADIEAPDTGNLRIVDSETGEQMEIYLDTMAQQRYLSNLTRHQENYHIAARRHGANLTTLTAETFLENQRLDDLLGAELIRHKTGG